jgi:hypothetical protein
LRVGFEGLRVLAQPRPAERGRIPDCARLRAPRERSSRSATTSASRLRRLFPFREPLRRYVLSGAPKSYVTATAKSNNGSVCPKCRHSHVVPAKAGTHTDSVLTRRSPPINLAQPVTTADREGHPPPPRAGHLRCIRSAAGGRGADARRLEAIRAVEQRGALAITNRLAANCSRVPVCHPLGGGRAQPGRVPARGAGAAREGGTSRRLGPTGSRVSARPVRERSEHGDANPTCPEICLTRTLSLGEGLQSARSGLPPPENSRVRINAFCFCKTL